MSPVVLAIVAVILCILFRILNVNSVAQKPLLFGKDIAFRETILKVAPVLNEPYVPPRLWGFSGHVQTVVHSVIGRLRCPLPLGQRTNLSLSDGSTLTYDTYQPHGQFEEDVTLAVCPGIGNTSESIYIRTFVHYAQRHGYRIAVLNHLGALKSVRLTAPRIFSYGHTEDYAEMLGDLMKKYPQSKLVLIGYSLGGNLVTKYLGEKRERPVNIIGGISVCQGYSAIEGAKYLLNWQNFRRFYLYVITEAVKNIILKHRYILFSEQTLQQLKFTEYDVISAATLPELDDVFTRRMYGFSSVDEMYRWSSSAAYMTAIKHPMIFINSKDDPLIPEELWSSAEKLCESRNEALFLSMANGGHLGFFEGGLIFPNPISWLDRAIIGLVGGLVLTQADLKIKS